MTTGRRYTAHVIITTRDCMNVLVKFYGGDGVGMSRERSDALEIIIMKTDIDKNFYDKNAVVNLCK